MSTESCSRRLPSPLRLAPARTPADTAEAWRRIRTRVTSWRDLDPALMTEVEKLIDFVTADHADTLEP